MRAICILIAFLVTAALTAQAADKSGTIGTDTFKVSYPWYDTEGGECVFSLDVGSAAGELRLRVGKSSSRLHADGWEHTISCGETGLVYVAKFPHELPGEQ